MDELRQLALEACGGDAAAAEALLADADERLRLEETLRASTAARRVEAWKALQPKTAVVLLPVVAAFVVGLVFGGGLGLVRVEPSRAIAVNATELSGPYEGVEPLELPFWLAERSAVVVRVEASDVDIALDGRDGVETVLEPGLHRVRLASLAGPWSVASLHLEAFEIPDLSPLTLALKAQELVVEGVERDPYNKWRSYHEARLLLLAAGLQADADYRAALRLEISSQRELDALCAAGREDVFPAPDQPCFFKRSQ